MHPRIVLVTLNRVGLVIAGYEISGQDQCCEHTASHSIFFKRGRLCQRVAVDKDRDATYSLKSSHFIIYPSSLDSPSNERKYKSTITSLPRTSAVFYPQLLF